MAYVIKSTTKDTSSLTFLPLTSETKDGRSITLVNYVPKLHEQEIFVMLKDSVDDGNSYPQETMDTIEDFRGYYASGNIFVCIDTDTKQLLGSFYIKPNFPGRCSHICNAGFLVKKPFRGVGIGNFMTRQYLRIARHLGYTGSLFNLVFETNISSWKSYEKMGFKMIGVVPKAGNLKDSPNALVDARMYYYDLTTIEL